MKHQHSSFQYGFTMIELIFTMAITGILSAMLLGALISARQQTTVRVAAEEFAAHAKEAISLTQNGVRDETPGSPCALDTEPRTGYCSQYHIGVDSDKAYHLSSWTERDYPQYQKVFTVPTNVTIDDLAPSNLGAFFGYAPPRITAGGSVALGCTPSGSAGTICPEKKADSVNEATLAFLFQYDGFSVNAKPLYVCVSKDAVVDVQAEACPP